MPFLLVLRIIQALWVVLIAYWVLAAFGNKRAKTRQSRGSRLAYVAGLAGAWYLLSHQRRPGFYVLPVNIVTQSLGILICAAGAAIAMWARSILGRNWSGLVTIKQDHELIQRGPYSIVRNPIYTGLILAAAGSVLALHPAARSFLFVLVLLAAFYIKSRHEEHVLAGEFGAQYTAYKQRVKAALVPFVL